jgi:hypothetical protein
VIPDAYIFERSLRILRQRISEPMVCANVALDFSKSARTLSDTWCTRSQCVLFRVLGGDELTAPKRSKCALPESASTTEEGQPVPADGEAVCDEKGLVMGKRKPHSRAGFSGCGVGNVCQQRAGRRHDCRKSCGDGGLPGKGAKLMFGG